MLGPSFCQGLELQGCKNSNFIENWKNDFFYEYLSDKLKTHFQTHGTVDKFPDTHPIGVLFRPQKWGQSTQF